MRIFDELKFAQNMETQGFQKTMSFGELLILAKYYFSLNFSKREVEQKLYSFCEKFYSEFNDIIYQEKISSVVRGANNKNLRICKSVPITQKEIMAIRELKNYRYEKVLFTMLVLGKYFNITSTSNKPSKFYYVSESQATILRLAHTSQKKNENIFGELHKLNLIDHELKSKRGSLFIKFTNAEDQSDSDILVDDMNNIVSFYPPYCKVCGLPLDKMHNRQEMHDECFEKNRKTYQKEYSFV